MRRAAFITSPSRGGIYSVFTAMRHALAPLGITLEWIYTSSDPQLIAAHGQDKILEQDQGRFVLTQDSDPVKRCRLLTSAISNGGYDTVFINAMADPVEGSLPVYLPPSIRRVMITHTITPSTYAAAKVIAPYVNLCVGVSPRIERKLRRLLPHSRVACVPSTMDFAPYDRIEPAQRSGGFQLLSLGRITDIDKGIFWMPGIMAKLTDLPVHLTIAGSGQDLEKLKRLCAPFGDRITFAGRIAPSDVPAFMAKHDALIMPSRFEGFGYTLIEAMAAGCVPVASSIGGVTTYIIGHEQTGLLFPIGDTAKAANAIRRLAADPAFRQRLADAGRKDVRARFAISTMTEAYRPLLATLDQWQPAAPRDINAMQLLSFGGQWRKFLPQGLKNYLRQKLLK